jgi:CRP-like cAMP-binding protein
LLRNDDTQLRVRSEYQRVLEAGESVFDQGDAGDHLYVIQAGEIELTREDATGQRVVARLGAGDFFGELSVVMSQPHSTRAVAVKTTRLLELDRATLESMCLAQPEIAIRMIRILASRLIEAERRLSMLGVDDLLRPVVRAVLRSAQPDPVAAGAGFVVRTTLRGIAEQAGLSMLEAHRALHQLFDRKLMRLADDRLQIPDLEALSAALESAD